MSESPADPVVHPYEDELREIGALLDGAPDRATRDAAKRRIVSLFKRVDLTLGRLTQLKQEIRELVERYKRLDAKPAGGPELHRDHLGASTFIEKGWGLIAQGDSAGAMVVLHRALELAPGDPQALSLLGWAEMQAGRLDDALATFSRVLVREPSNALARVNVGYICLKKRVFGEAIEHLSRVIRLADDPKASLYAHYYLGLVYLERGMFGDAQAFLRKALELGPNLIEAYHDLGRAHWLAGQRDLALAAWKTGAAGRFTQWAKACQELLDRAARGEEVLRSPSS